jgi:predicted metal-dependent hydrolase
LSAVRLTVAVVGEPVVEVEGFRGVRQRSRRASGPGGTIAGTDLSTVEVRRSNRRRRTVAAYREGERTIVLVPARFTRAEEREWVATMLERLAAQEARRRPTDAQLHARAVALADRWLGPGPRPDSVTWSTRQGHRFGSCTPEDRTIRITSRLRDAPAYVVDAVLLHELAHLVEPTHSARFHALVSVHPDHKRASAWLEGFAAGEAAARGASPAEAIDDEPKARPAPEAAPVRRPRPRPAEAAYEPLPFPTG